MESNFSQISLYYVSFYSHIYVVKQVYILHVSTNICRLCHGRKYHTELTNSQGNYLGFLGCLTRDSHLIHKGLTGLCRQSWYISICSLFH